MKMSKQIEWPVHNFSTEIKQVHEENRSIWLNKGCFCDEKICILSFILVVMVIVLKERQLQNTYTRKATTEISYPLQT